MRLAGQVLETFVTFSLIGFMGPKFETFSNFRKSAMVKIVCSIEAATQHLHRNCQICPGLGRSVIVEMTRRAGSIAQILISKSNTPE